MTGKSTPPAEFRMRAADFDGMMHSARFEAPPKKVSPKKSAKAKAPKKKRAA